jgi:hypothetical protein
MTTSSDAAAPSAEAVIDTAEVVDAKAPAANGATKESKDPAPVKDVPKPDQPRLPKPDRRELDARVAELQEAADVKQARIEELKRAIETRRDARKNVAAGSQGKKTRIQELNQQFQARMVRSSHPDRRDHDRRFRGIQETPRLAPRRRAETRRMLRNTTRAKSERDLFSKKKKKKKKKLSSSEAKQSEAKPVPV